MNNVKIPFQNKNRDTVIPYLLFIFEIVIAGIAGTAQYFNWPVTLKKNVFEDLNDFNDFVFTCSTMTTAVVILCYSILDSKRLGISNRTIIRYQIGNMTLPIAFIISLIKLPIFKVCIYLEWEYALIFELPWSLGIQFAIIAFIIRASSMNTTINVIARQENWQYKKILEYEWDKWEVLEIFSLWKISHIQQAMSSDELFSDKLRLLKTVLKKEEVKWYSQMSQRNAFYSFYYNNAYEAFCAVKNNLDEQQLLYTFFYSEVGELIETSKGKIFDERINSKEESSKDEKIKIEYMLNLAVSAIINAAMFSGVRDAEIFSNYMLKEVCSKANPKLRNRQIIYYFYTMELFYRTNKMKVREVYIKELCELIKNESYECMDMRFYEYWEFITRKCTLDKKISEMIYYDAGLTLMGRKQSSVLMLYILQLINGSARYER